MGRNAGDAAGVPYAPRDGGGGVDGGIETSARRFGHYAWIEERLFEIMGGWVVDTAEPSVKLLFGAQARHHAWHAELWRARLPVATGFEAGHLVAPTGEAQERLVAALAGPASEARGQETVERLVGIYRVLVPRLIVTYGTELESASPLAGAPVARAARQVLHDEIDDWRLGEAVLQSLIDSAETAGVAARRQGEIEALLVRSGPLAGPDSPDVGSR